MPPKMFPLTVKLLVSLTFFTVVYLTTEAAKSNTCHANAATLPTIPGLPGKDGQPGHNGTDDGEQGLPGPQGPTGQLERQSVRNQCQSVLSLDGVCVGGGGPVSSPCLTV